MAAMKSVFLLCCFSGLSTVCAAAEIAPTLEDVARETTLNHEYWLRQSPPAAVEDAEDATPPVVEAPAAPPVPATPSLKPARSAPLIAVAYGAPTLQSNSAADAIPDITVAEAADSLQTEPPSKPSAPAQPLFLVEPVAAPAPLEFSAAKVDAKDFLKAEADLRKAFDSAGEHDKLAAARALAMFYVANQFHAEALDVLHDADAPTDRADYGLLAAIAQFGLGRYRETVAILNDETYRNDSTAACWRGMANAARGAYEAASDDLSGNARACRLPDWAVYGFSSARVETALALNQTKIAESALGAARRAAKTDAERAENAWLEAALLAARGDTNAARARFEQLAAGPAEPAASRAALALLADDIQTGAVDVADARDRLRTLALRWHGGAFEREALSLMLKVENKAGDFRAVFETGRRLLDSDPEADKSDAARAMLAAALPKLFDKDAGVSPMTAAEMFYRNIDLAPPGRDGDVLIRDVADKLIALDLLAPASELLEHQVSNRLRGAERSEVAAKLARVYLEDRRPSEALRVLRATRFARLPDDVNEDRRQLEAKALEGAGDADAALALLEGDQTPEARSIVGAIRWDRKEWNAAAVCFTDALKPALEKDAPFGDRERDWALRAAAAYTLAGETDALADLRGAIEDKLGAAPAREIFDALAGADDDSLSQFLNAYRSLYVEG